MPKISNNLIRNKKNLISGLVILALFSFAFLFLYPNAVQAQVSTCTPTQIGGVITGLGTGLDVCLENNLNAGTYCSTGYLVCGGPALNPGTVCKKFTDSPPGNSGGKTILDQNSCTWSCPLGQISTCDINYASVPQAQVDDPNYIYNSPTDATLQCVKSWTGVSCDTTSSTTNDGTLNACATVCTLTSTSTSPLPSCSIGQSLIHDGSGWICTLNNDNFWRLIGNDLTGLLNKFLGTTSDDDLVFRTFNLPRAVITKTGEVGIGIPVPLAKLDVGGVTSTRGLVTDYTMFVPQTITPVASNGMVYYDSASNKFMCYENGWKECIGGGSSKWTDDGILDTKTWLTKLTNKVGIGTITPQEKLTLGQDSNFAVEMKVPVPLVENLEITGPFTTASSDFSFRTSALDGAGGETALSTLSQLCLVSNLKLCKITWPISPGAFQYRIYGEKTSPVSDKYQTVTVPSSARVILYTPVGYFWHTDQSANIPDPYNNPFVPSSYLTTIINGWTKVTSTIQTDPFYFKTSTSATDVPTKWISPNDAITTAYVNKITAGGRSWIKGGNFGIGTATPTTELDVSNYTTGTLGSTGSAITKTDKLQVDADSTFGGILSFFGLKPKLNSSNPILHGDPDNEAALIAGAPALDQGILYYDAEDNKFKVNENNSNLYRGFAHYELDTVNPNGDPTPGHVLVWDPNSTGLRTFIPTDPLSIFSGTGYWNLASTSSTALTPTYITNATTTVSPYLDGSVAIKSIATSGVTMPVTGTVKRLDSIANSLCIDEFTGRIARCGAEYKIPTISLVPATWGTFNAGCPVSPSSKLITLDAVGGVDLITHDITSYMTTNTSTTTGSISGGVYSPTPSSTFYVNSVTPLLAAGSKILITATASYQAPVPFVINSGPTNSPTVTATWRNVSYVGSSTATSITTIGNLSNLTTISGSTSFVRAASALTPPIPIGEYLYYLVPNNASFSTSLTRGCLTNSILTCDQALPTSGPLDATPFWDTTHGNINIKDSCTGSVDVVYKVYRANLPQTAVVGIFGAE